MGSLAGRQAQEQAPVLTALGFLVCLWVSAQTMSRGCFLAPSDWCELGQMGGVTVVLLLMGHVPVPKCESLGFFSQPLMSQILSCKYKFDFYQGYS